jgi:aspartate/methionine/tyrosine aminotransferase
MPAFSIINRSIIITMPLPVFLLEDYLTRHEFSAPHLLGCSDAESVPMHDLLAMATPEQLSQWELLSLGYTETWGSPALRACIAEQLYPELTAENILCFAGAEEGIYAAMQVLCEPQKQVLVITPCYQSLATLPDHAGAIVVPVELQESEQWKLPLDRIATLMSSQVQGVIINFPHNPTGQVITQQELDALGALCARYDAWLFSDEVYRLLGNPETGWPQPAASAYPKAISLGVMSKAYGLAGLRVGWLACQDVALLQRIKQVKDYLSICNSAPSEILSHIALSQQKHLLVRNNALVESNRRLVDAVIQQHADTLEWVTPQGGCVGFVRYKGPLPLTDWCQQLLQRHGVLVLPGTVDGMSTPHFRVGFGRATLPESLRLFDAFLHQEKAAQAMHA